MEKRTKILISRIILSVMLIGLTIAYLKGYDMRNAIDMFIIIGFSIIGIGKLFKKRKADEINEQN